MRKFLIRLLYKWEFKALRNRVAGLDKKIKDNPDPQVRAYHAKTGPSRIRFEEELDRALELPEPQRDKFILHLIAQFYGLSGYYSGFFSELCKINCWPYLLTDLGFYTRQAESHLLNLLDMFWQMLTLYNKENGSKYKPVDFLGLPPDPGTKVLVRLHSDAFKAAKLKPDSQALLPIGFCHFEMERFSLLLELRMMEAKAGTEYLSPLSHLRGIGIGHLGACPVEPFAQVGVDTIDALTLMVRTAYERAR